MKKRFMVTLMIATLISLTGCSGVNSFIEDKMMEKSGVFEDEKYIEYQSQLEAGNADENGYFVECMQQTQQGSIHITFSMNNNLDINYYTDKECDKQIDIANCFLNPGSSIYADVMVSEDVYSSMYEFASFNICEYDDEGNRTVIDKCEQIAVATEKGCQVEIIIPSDFKGKELSIEPLGKYRMRQIKLNDYYIDEADNEHPLDGTWMIDDEISTEDVAEISAISSYIISYEYDSEEYFYSSSIPECYYNNNEDGIVIFNQREATDKTEDYSVELHKYISVSLVSGVDRVVAVDGGGMQTLKANTELSISKLKYGDKVIIETNKPWTDLETNRELILTKTEPLSTGSYKYTLIVPEKDGQFMFDPTEYEYEHGTVVFKCFGSAVTDKQCLAQGSKIYYEQGSAEDGYWLPTEDNCIVVSSEEETRKQLEEIHFVEMIQVSVSLKQPDFGGEIKYFVDGKQIYKSEYETYSGTVITMDFEPWEGWRCPYEDGMEYIVGESSSQIINVNGTDISRLFTEDENHKPKLNVTLEKSVEQDIKFDFTASGLDSQSYTYESGWFRSDYKIIDGNKIGTESPIVISVQNKARQSDKAVKIVVTKTDSDKKTETAEIRYIIDSTEPQEPIYIYKNADVANATKRYSSIDIVVSMVDVTSFNKASASPNTIVTVYNADTMKEIKQGDLIEEAQKVVVKIEPSTGYYIVGGNNSDKTEYQDTMKYSKYVKDINGLINKYCAEKICTVKLDASDTFAKYVYKYDGEVVAGTVDVRAGKEITLEYEIIGDGYKLSEGSGGVLGIGKSYKKVTKTITITNDMDGETITKADFNIEVEKGE